MQARVIQCENITDLKSRLDTERSSDFSPSLAVAFAADALVNEELARTFAERDIQVFGGCSSEEIAGADLSRASIVVMLLEMDPALFRLRTFPNEGRDGRDMGRQLGDWARESFTNPALMLLMGGAGTTISGDRLLSGLFETAPGLPTFGGITSSGTYAPLPPFFTNGAVHTDGILGLTMDANRIELSGTAISGWREVGTPKQITRARDNLVLEIEGMPALDFYERYFNVRADSVSGIMNASEYPMRVERSDGSHVIRTAVRVDPEIRGVYFGGEIPEGSIVRFCSPNIVETIQHTVGELQNFRASGPPTQPDAVILFDCAIRSRSFGSYMHKEIEVISELWNAPLIGFSSWGEIGAAPGESCGLHNTALSVVLLRDKGKLNSTDDSARVYSNEEVENFIEAFPADATVESLKNEVIQLRKQKTMLSNFLHLTSDDLEREREKSEELLLNILPGAIAARLKSGETTIADSINRATIVFADLAGFTAMSDRMNASELVKILNRLFSSFDELAYKYGVEKIKTIGDAYMAAAGLPDPRPDHARIALKLARGLLRITEKFNEKYDTNLQVRIGLNSGPVVAGVIGRRKFTYDLWGDAVNVASRMESNGVTGRIHVSESTYDLLKDEFQFDARGEIEVKGKGLMKTYLFKDAADE